MTDKTDKPHVTGRRDFLKVLGGTSALAATSVATTLPAEAQQESKDERLKARYKETDHVKSFYKTNRY